jgi:hypothetical protein
MSRSVESSRPSQGKSGVVLGTHVSLYSGYSFVFWAGQEGVDGKTLECLKCSTDVIALAVPYRRENPASVIIIRVRNFTKRVSTDLSNVVWIGGCERLHFFICYVGEIAENESASAYLPG